MKQKVIGIPIIILLLVGISSAAIIIAGISYMSIGGVGVYTSAPPPSPIPANFTICDGDFNDTITFNISGKEVMINFPLWINQSNIEYRDVMKITPLQTGSLIISEMQRSNVGISNAQLQIYPLNAMEYNYPYGIPPVPQTNAVGLSVIAGNEYMVSFKITTYDSEYTYPGVEEWIKFKLEVR